MPRMHDAPRLLSLALLMLSLDLSAGSNRSPSLLTWLPQRCLRLLDDQDLKEEGQEAEILELSDQVSGAQYSVRDKPVQLLDLQPGTFTGSGAGLPTLVFFWIWSGTFSKSLYVDSQGFAFFVVCICLKVNPLLMQRNLFAKCARLPVPLFSHSTGFSMVHTGSIRSV